MTGQTRIGALVRRSWLVVIVTVMVCAGFTARAVAALVEASYLAPTSRGAPVVLPAKLAAPVRKPPDDGGLVARNMFCSTCGSRAAWPRPDECIRPRRGPDRDELR